MFIVKKTSNHRLRALQTLSWLFVFIFNALLLYKAKHPQQGFRSLMAGDVGSDVWGLLLFQIGVLVGVEYALFKIKKIGIWVLLATVLLTIAQDIEAFVVTKNYAIAFYVLFIVIFSVQYFLTIIQFFNHSYFNSGMAWFEGLPVMLPKVSGNIASDTEESPLQISSLDQFGCFAYPKHFLKTADELILKADDVNLNIKVKIISRTHRGHGVGLSFEILNRDEEKRISEFLDYVRSRGYVE